MIDISDAMEQAYIYTLWNDRTKGLSKAEQDELWDIAEDNFFTALYYAYSLGFQRGREDPEK